MLYYPDMGSNNEKSLLAALDGMNAEASQALKRHEFQRELLLKLRQKMLAGELKNHVDGTIEAPTLADVISPPTKGSPEWEELKALGDKALAAGQCALVVLAGGMATRMGGVIKALVPAVCEKSFLELRLTEQASLARKYQHVPPLWLMTSYATDEGIREALGDRLDGETLATFVQGLSVRLTQDGELFQTSTGEPSLYSPGHGDLPDALAHSGLLKAFIERGGKYVLVTNIDNLGGGLDPVLIGMHLKSRAKASCEVVDKRDSDRGGIPARLNGRPVVLEEFRIPPGFDPSQVRVFNVNSFAFDADAFASLDFQWTYFQVKKTVEDRAAIQFERLINEVTFHLDTQYIRVPREGSDSRFLPVKDYDELAERQPELLQLASARGMLEE